MLSAGTTSAQPSGHLRPFKVCARIDLQIMDESSQTTDPDRTRPPRGGAEYSFRHPRPEDGASLFDLVRTSGALEANSAYAYVMACDHFAGTCLLALREGRAAGFVLAFVSPARPDAVFVWQIGVAPSERGRGLGQTLLKRLIAAPACRAVSHLEATVAPSNRASQALFTGFARSLGVPCAISAAAGYGAALFPGTHEAEPLYRIGPFAGRPEQTL